LGFCLYFWTFILHFEAWSEKWSLPLFCISRDEYSNRATCQSLYCTLSNYQFSEFSTVLFLKPALHSLAETTSLREYPAIWKTQTWTAPLSDPHCASSIFYLPSMLASICLLWDDDRIWSPPTSYHSFRIAPKARANPARWS
jgi:hypothetical protein